jgi:hypothetical protein
MKKFYVFTIGLIIVVSNLAIGQVLNIDFDDSTNLDHIVIDTSNINNIWQIGSPLNKGGMFILGAYTEPNVIVTDTVNPYPINDTSRFTIKHYVNAPPYGGAFLRIEFYFMIDSEPPNDYGIMELSFDNGNTWTNILTDDSLYYYYWFEPKPSFAGTIFGWNHFSVQISNIPLVNGETSTVLVRFTFQTDSVPNYKDGWMIDHFSMGDFWEGIGDNKDSNIELYPNPVDLTLSVKTAETNTKQSITILNELGQMVYSDRNFNNKAIYTGQMPNGFYFLKYSTGYKTSFAKFVVNHN